MRNTFKVEPWTGLKIDVIDTGDYDRSMQCIHLVQAHTDCIIQMEKVSNAICQMVDNITYSVRESGGLSLLRFWAHGTEGMQNISSSKGMFDVSHNNALMYLNVDENAYYLQRLFPLFAADGIIEFHGCSVGGGTNGESFLKQVAYATNVPAVGSPIDQGGPDTKLSAATGVGWEGDGWVTVAFPDGTIIYGPGSSL